MVAEAFANRTPASAVILALTATEKVCPFSCEIEIVSPGPPVTRSSSWNLTYFADTERAEIGTFLPERAVLSPVLAEVVPTPGSTDAAHGVSVGRNRSCSDELANAPVVKDEDRATTAIPLRADCMKLVSVIGFFSL